MFALRMVGVITMLSTIFPTFLLAKEVLRDEKKALFFSAASLMLPSFMNVAYCMQEVLSYPLFLWVSYFIYKELSDDAFLCFSRKTLVLVILCICGYFTKTYMIFLPLVYIGLILLNGWTSSKRLVWKKPVVFISLYCILYVLFKNIILFINNGVQGSNHYSTQFARLFPITGETVIAAMGCMGLYFVALLFYWGVVPIALPVFNWKKHEKRDMFFLLFLQLCFLILVVEIVVSIVLTEEGNVFFPHKVLYRYFQILEIPFFLCFFNNYKKYRITSKMWIVYIPVFVILGVYYSYIGVNTTTAIIDAPFFLLLENISKYIIPHFSLLVLIFIAVGLVVIFYRWKQDKMINILQRYSQIVCLVLVIFFGINLVQLPLYTNIIANGNIIEEDGIKIANYYIKNKDRYENIYFLSTSEGSYEYERAVYAYMPQAVIFINEFESDKLEGSGLVICDENYLLDLPEAEIYDLQSYSVYYF